MGAGWCVAEDVEQGEQGRRLVSEGLDLLPAIPIDGVTRPYYRNLMGLVRAQTDLHKVFTADAFKRFVFYGKADLPGTAAAAAASGAAPKGSSVMDRTVNNVLEGALAAGKQQQPSNQQAAVA